MEKPLCSLAYEKYYGKTYWFGIHFEQDTWCYSKKLLKDACNAHDHDKQVMNRNIED